MNVHDLRDRTKALTFAAPVYTSLDDLARLPRGTTGSSGGPPAAPLDDTAILAALGDGPLPADVSLLKHIKREHDREGSGRNRTRRDRRARRARGLSR